ncbi:MAG: HAD family phosphatase [Thermoanaerobaculia bacterium]
MRALLLDLGNVLVRFDHGRTLGRIEQATGVPAERLRPHIFGGLERSLDLGELTSVEFFRLAEDAAGLPRLPDSLWIEAWRDIFEPIPEALALIPRLVPELATAVVSNTNELHWDGVLRVSPVDRLVDALVLSFEVGYVKPDERIWRTALDRLGSAANETTFADDRADLVEAARTFGLDAFVVDSPATLETELGRRGLLMADSL